MKKLICLLFLFSLSFSVCSTSNKKVKSENTLVQLKRRYPRKFALQDRDGDKSKQDTFGYAPCKE